MRVVMVSLAVLMAAASAVAGEIQVNGIGSQGWKSWDTRDNTGRVLLGTNLTDPNFGGWVGGNSVADDALIVKQIKLMNPGEVADMQDGRTPPAAPAGSYNNLGYLRLDATDANAGKADLSYVSSSGLGAPSDVLGSGFSTRYRFYDEPMTTVRTVGLNISLVTSSFQVYSFAHVGAAAAANTWEERYVTDTIGDFYLYGPGAPGGAGPVKTLAAWAADETWGPVVFASDAEVFRTGFNLGSYQRNSLAYVDWVETSLLNGGDRIDFVGSAVPEPATMALLALGGVGLVGRWVRKRKEA